MSLLDEMMETFVIMDKTTSSDGLGGYVAEWVEGAEISGALTFDSSVESRIAMAQGLARNYTFTTKKSIVLDYNVVIKRVSDGRTFRITSDGRDKFTPGSANLNIRQVTAEDWKM